jgi:hypothetical protein
MQKNLILTILSIGLLCFSCSKSNKSDIVPPSNPPENHVIKLTLVSGDGQTDSLGNQLTNPIIVKVTQDGIATSGYTVEFVASGCAQTDTISTPSQPDGTAVFDWSLSGGIGQQTATMYVLNSNKKKVDSVKATATGLQPGPGWHRSLCSVFVSSSPATFCKLNSGRLFTCFGGGKTYLRYSDDNGVSWYAVKSLGNTHTITWVLSTPTDEIFAFTEGTDGTFYSNDAGQTWSNLGVPPFNTELFSSIICTASGKLIAATAGFPLKISNDKGKTWNTIQSSAFVPQGINGFSYSSPAEDKNGNLYILASQQSLVNIYKSSDGGQNWNIMPESGYNIPGDVFSFYVDNSNWFYKSTEQFNPGIYISKDNGINYAILIPGSPVTEFTNMSVQSDGKFYYETGNSLFQYDATSGISKNIYGNGYDTRVSAYIVAKNNNIIVDNQGGSYIRYYTK